MYRDYNDALGYHRRNENLQAYDRAFRNGERYQDRFTKAVSEIDKLYQSGSPNMKRIKRWVDVAWDG